MNYPRIFVVNAECGISATTKKIIKTPAGRLPGYIMRFKIDKNLLTVARASENFPEITPAAEVAETLCRKFIDAGLIEDAPIVWGTTVAEETFNCLVSDVCKVLCDYLGVASVSSDVFDAFCKVVILGDGDCPECGGKMMLLDTEGHDEKHPVYGWEWITDCYVFECLNCGEIIKKNY